MIIGGEMNKYTKYSLVLSSLHFLMVISFFILLFTLGNIPGPMHPLIMPFFFYMLLSFIAPLFILIFCIIGLVKEDKKTANIICLILSIFYELGFIMIIILIWPIWMGV